MTTNQTIDGVQVSRQLLCRVITTLEKPSEKWEQAGWPVASELRALLDKGVSGDSRAPQAQGEPVACTHGIRAPHACDQCAEQNDVPDYWEDPDTGTCIDQWTKIQGLNGTEAFTVPLYRHAEQPAPVAVVSSGGHLRAEARQCDNCNHVGINDSGVGIGACHDCEWQGPEPIEDKCPGCDSENCMAAACPKCGARYVLLAEKNLPIQACLDELKRLNPSL